MDNTPHVPFFEPIIEELKARQYPVLVTARDAFQVCELADAKRLEYIRIGRHSGKNPVKKLVGLTMRALQLRRVVLTEGPAIGVSHGARSQLILGTLLGIPTLLLKDYEYCQFPPMMRPTWIMGPEHIPAKAMSPKTPTFAYSGIKEDVYAWKVKPDPIVLRELGVRESEILVTVRPPATEAHYHNPESEILFQAFMDRAIESPNVRVVLLPRNPKQLDRWSERLERWGSYRRMVIPSKAVDGLNLIWHSDLVVSGGGTMNREAAALNVPVYSIFRGPLGAVDRHLRENGRLVLIESLHDVHHRIALTKRCRTERVEITSKRALHDVVNTIEKLASACSSKKPEHQRIATGTTV